MTSKQITLSAIEEDMEITEDKSKDTEVNLANELENASQDLLILIEEKINAQITRW